MLAIIPFGWNLFLFIKKKKSERTQWDNVRQNSQRTKMRKCSFTHIPHIQLHFMYTYDKQNRPTAPSFPNLTPAIPPIFPVVYTVEIHPVSCGPMLKCTDLFFSTGFYSYREPTSAHKNIPTSCQMFVYVPYQPGLSSRPSPTIQ